jgi:alpha-1,3-rhamnosyl/mannosyltransferase
MRIGIDGRYIQDHFPGIGRYTYNLSRALTQVAPDEVFVLLHNPALLNTRYDLACLIHLPNIELVRINVPTFSWTEQLRLPLVIGYLSLDVCHSPYYIKPYWLPCPSVVTIYDLISKLYPQYLPSPWARLTFEFATRLALRSAQRVITASQAARSDLIVLYHLAPKKIAVTPLAADERFRPLNQKEIELVRHKYDLPEHYALYLGINKPHKNLVRLIEAWSLLIGHCSLGFGHWPLVIAGHWDPRYPQARERAQQLGLEQRVRFLGPVAEADLPALYSGADLFVFPSLYEGFGLPVLEAMACGVPVVCSKTSSLPEIVGEAALTFDPLDVEEMAAKIEKALGDEALREEMREKGLQRAARFSWERTAEKTLEVYRAVVSKGFRGE